MPDPKMLLLENHVPIETAFLLLLLLLDPPAEGFMLPARTIPHVLSHVVAETSIYEGLRPR